MNVHLIKTPEYGKIQFEEVFELLSSFHGPLRFFLNEYAFSEEDFPFLKRYRPEFTFKNVHDTKMVDYIREAGFPLSWRELFSLCDYFRNIFLIPEEDFVVLLTNRKNSLNWFSHVHGRNVFVHIGDWGYYTRSNPKYPIAYQVVENVMQSLMELDVTGEMDDCIHMEAIGCMNDFCRNKEQILLKLRTADICQLCQDKMKQKQIPNALINQVHEIFEGIRKELLFKQNYNFPTEPGVIEVSARLKITIPDFNNLELRLNPLFKTLYIFFLRHPEGVRLKDLVDFRKEFVELYGQLTNTDDNNAIQDNINDLINPHSNSFSQKKSKINKIITDLLGNELSEFYKIEGKRGQAFKIPLDPALIHFL